MSRFARGLAAVSTAVASVLAPVVALALAPASAHAAEPARSANPSASAIAVVTIAEGASTVLRGTARSTLVEGARLVAGDIVETAPDARLLRLEFDDGTYANLGPATRLLLAPRLAERGRASAPAYLLQGWLKTAAPVLSPMVDVTVAGAALVLRVRPEGTQVFSEAGAVTLVARHEPNKPVQLAAGQLHERAGSSPGAARPPSIARPTPAFLQALPPPFLDTLPPLAPRFKGRAATPKPVAEATYADLQPWLTAEPALRRSLQARWTPLVRQPAFRQALVANLAAHPEWERVLFPERFLPASSPRSLSTPSSSGYR